jgi:hypothetical protein
MRPDYTVSFWPEEFEVGEAEAQELAVHIHFDAKYRVDNITELFGKADEDLSEEKFQQRAGNYKRADLLKMHAYKDAIRRTGGAYILYPGTKEKELRGFHEIIPGLGAFAINPSEETIGLKNLSDFIDKVIDHLLDRASQRENLSAKIYTIHKEPKEDKNILNEPMPEYINNVKLIPDETFVIVGYCSTKEKLLWYEENGMYNFRMNDENGTLILDNETVNAKYLLLRESGNEFAQKIYKITSKGPKVYSRERLINLKYPSTNSSHEHYLVINIEKQPTLELGSKKWEFKKLKKYLEVIESNKNYRIASGIPFPVSIKELMKVAKD